MIYKDYPQGSEWMCIEGHIKLNDPGQSNGIEEFWLDDALGLTLMYTQVLNFPRTITPRGRRADGAAVGGGNAVTESDIDAAGLERVERNPDAAGRYERLSLTEPPRDRRCVRRAEPPRGCR